MDLRFALVGLVVGALVGLTGSGGGSLMTPLMILVLGVKPLVAVGTDLAYGAVTRIVGGATHVRQGTVHRRTALLLASGSVPASVLGVVLTTRIERVHPEFVNVFLLRSIAWALIVVAVSLFLKPLIPGVQARREASRAVNWRGRLEARGSECRWLLPAVGLVIGFLVGLTSVGAGSLVIVVLLLLYPRWQSKDVVGTDVFHAAVLTSGASAAQLVAGNVNVPMMLSLLVGSIPGVILGSRLVIDFPDRLLRVSIASVLLISGAKLL